MTLKKENIIVAVAAIAVHAAIIGYWIYLAA